MIFALAAAALALVLMFFGLSFGGKMPFLSN